MEYDYDKDGPLMSRRCLFTNADRIRAMSDEELARELCCVETGVTTYSEQIYLHWLDWLEREATDG